MVEELVSVIVPIYNVEPYLERCIQSIQRQTYRNIEIILVNDGSPDRSGEICDKYAEMDKRIKVYHKPNGGLSDARNCGVAQSTGEYITFIDSDDYVASDYIEYLHDLIREFDADISCCNRLETDENNALFLDGNVVNEFLLDGKETCFRLFYDLYDVLVTAWGKLFKSRIVKNCSFPKGRKHEDEATTCKYYYQASRVVIGSRCLYAYYKNPTGIMNSRDLTIIDKDMIWALEHRSQFFEECGEITMAQIAWDRLFYYCLYDSMDHDGRCDLYLKNLSQQKKISKRAKFELELYNRSPWLLDCYLNYIIYPVGRLRDKVKYRR